MKYRLPGLCDLQVNGFAGVDYNNANLGSEDLSRSLEAMRRTGVMLCLPTVITSSADHFAKCAAGLGQVDDPMIAGLHMEGPYISPVDGPRGAHPLAHVADASVEDFKRRQDSAQGRIKLVTLAPEVPGAMKLIEYLVAQKIVVAIGHSDADDSSIYDAVTAGATLSTHLGNGCHGTMDRHRNILWPQLAEDLLYAGLIVDGHHLPRPVVQAMIKAKGIERSVLVTDAVAAAGASPGIYQLGEFEVELNEAGRVNQVGSSNLAGSALTLEQAVARTCDWCELPIQTAWGMASTLPAKIINTVPRGEVEVEWDAGTSRLEILSKTP